MAPQVTQNGVQYTDFQADTPESMKNEKRALLAMMAEHGTEGQAAYVAAQQRAKDLRKQSIEMAAARGQQIHAPGTLQAELTQNEAALMGGLNENLVSGAVGHGREMDRIAAANAAYFDQLSGASQLNRDMLAAQIAMQNAGGGGGGGGGGGTKGTRDYSGAKDTVPAEMFREPWHAGKGYAPGEEPFYDPEGFIQGSTFYGPGPGAGKAPTPYGAKTPSSIAAAQAARERYVRRRAGQGPKTQAAQGRGKSVY